MAENIARIITVEVKIRVVCEIYNGRLVCLGIVFYFNRVVSCERVYNVYFYRAGEILCAVRVYISERKRRLLAVCRIQNVPYSRIVARVATVQTVYSVIVFVKRIFNAVKGKASAAYSVCKAAYKSALVRCTVYVAFKRIISENNVSEILILVFCYYADKSSAVCCDVESCSELIFQCVQKYFFAVLEAEAFFCYAHNFCLSFIIRI